MVKKVNWRKLSWVGARKLLLPYLLGLVAKYLTGPWGWLATKIIPILVDKVLRPGFLWATRKIAKVKDVATGKRRARRLEDAKNPTDYLDELNRK